MIDYCSCGAGDEEYRISNPKRNHRDKQGISNGEVKEKKGRRKGFILNLSSPGLPVAISLPANLAYVAQAPNRNRDIIQKTTQDVNRTTPISAFPSGHHLAEAEEQERRGFGDVG